MIVLIFFLLYTKLIDPLIVYLYTLKMSVDPITRQTYDYATPITSDNNPRNIIELDPDSNEQDFYILGPEPIKRKPPLMFTPSQIKTTIRPNTFAAQDAGIFLMLNMIISGTELYFLNILILHFSYSVKLLVIPLIQLKLLITMQIPLMILHTIHYVLDYMIN